MDIVSLLIGVLLSLIGLYVLLLQIKSNINRTFGLFSIIYGFWAISLFLYNNPIIISAQNWLRIVYLIVNLILAMFILFTYYFPFKSRDYTNVVIISVLILLLSIPLHILIFWKTNLLIREVSLRETGYVAEMGSLYPYYGMYWTVLFSVPVLILFRKYRESVGRARYQLKILALSLIISVIPILLVDIALPIIIKDTTYYSMSPLFAIIFVIAIAYSIVKYRFLGVRFVLGKFVQYLLLTFLLLFYGYVFYIVQIHFLKEYKSIESIILSVIFTSIITLIFFRLVPYFIQYLNKVLIYHDFNPSIICETIEEIGNTKGNLTNIFKEIVSIIKRSLRSKQVAILLFCKDNNRMKQANAIGFSYNNTLISRIFSIFVDLEKYINANLEVIVYDEISKRDDIKYIQLTKLMRERKMAIIIPFFVNNFLGLLILGYKENEDIYTIQDIDLLKKIVLKLGKIFSKFNLSYEEVMSTLKNFSSPNLLSGSSLLNLKKVKQVSTQYNVSIVEALRNFISSSIEYFKPTGDNKRRTNAQLKYEILKMIAYERATESQIMWDLGFDVYTRSVEEKVKNGRKPRFELKDASEYTATSIRSFKRLKKEAIEMLGWKLGEEGE